MLQRAQPVHLRSRSTALIGAAALGWLVGPIACGKSTEIVLAIDTDLAVPGEIDRVQLSIAGPTQNVAPVSVDLTASGAATFPLTLGLTPGGALSPVSIDAVALLAGSPVVTRDVQTAFIEGSSRILSILLTLSCENVTCSTDQSCDQGACVPIAQPGTGLPPWTGSTPSRPSDQPTLVGGRSVWASGWHSCATKGSSFSCWGRNDDGELGIGSTTRVPTRRAVISLPAPASVGLGETHSCTCDRTGQAWCWGSNSDGQLGSGDMQAHLTPIAIAGLTDCVQIAGGGFHTCAVRAGGMVSCWGRNNEGQSGQPIATTSLTTPKAVPGLSAVVEIRAGDKFTCARQTNGAIVCWGDNSMGQLGDGTLTSRDTTARVMNVGNNPAEIAAGRFFACVRLAAGTVSCWGNSSAIGASVVKTATDVAGITDAIQMATGQLHACVLHVTGAVSCWGSNQYGQLGTGGLDSATPVTVGAIPNDATSIALGIVHSCARRATGIVCWGQNVLQQLGDGSGADQGLPVSVVGF